MSKNRYSEFKALLLAQREQLIEEVQAKIAASDSGPASQSKITDDDGLADAAAEVNVAMVMRENQELQDVDGALTRIEQGSYGYCTDCGDEIGRSRLKVYPTAKRCLPCQEKYESAQRQIRAAGA